MQQVTNVSISGMLCFKYTCFCQHTNRNCDLQVNSGTILTKWTKLTLNIHSRAATICGRNSRCD